MSNQEVMTTAEVAAYVRVSQHTIRRWAKAGNFPRPMQLGPQRVGWLRAQVEQWLGDRAAAAQDVTHPDPASSAQDRARAMLRLIQIDSAAGA